MKYLIIFLILVLVAISGCNPDNQNEENNQQTPPAENNEQAPAENQQVPENNVFSELEDFFNMKGQASFMVTYNMKSDVLGQTYDSEMTQYVKNAEKFRIDTESEGVESRTFIDGNTYTSCTNQDEWQCIEITYEPTEAEKIQSDVEENFENYNIEGLSSKTIAGTKAMCYRITVLSSTVDYCFSKEGVPLYIKTEGEGFSSELTATAYSTSVSDSVFDFPAEPVDLTSLLPEGVEIPDY